MSVLEQAEGFSRKFSDSIEQLSSIRNQFEHMHSQIVASQTGSGPISIVFGEEGRTVKFRKLKMEIERLHELIEGSFRVIAGLYPAFNADSPPEAGGPMKLTMTVSISVVGGNVDKLNSEQ